MKTSNFQQLPSASQRHLCLTAPYTKLWFTPQIFLADPTGSVYEIFTYLIYTVFRNGRVVTERVDPLLRSLEKNAKKELCQYPAILTSRLVNNAYKQT